MNYFHFSFIFDLCFVWFVVLTHGNKFKFPFCYSIFWQTQNLVLQLKHASLVSMMDNPRGKWSANAITSTTLSPNYELWRKFRVTHSSWFILNYEHCILNGSWLRWILNMGQAHVWRELSRYMPSGWQHIRNRQRED